jgi:hypothetical protein
MGIYKIDEKKRHYFYQLPIQILAVIAKQKITLQ